MSDTTNSCSTKRYYDKKGQLVTKVTCPTGFAVYTESKNPMQASRLSLVGVGPDKDREDLRFYGDDALSMKRRAPYNTLVDGRAGNDPSNAASVSCGVFTVPSTNVSKNVKQQVMIEAIQDYAKNHPDVVAELAKVNPRIGGILDNNLTLTEALNAPAPQWRACPPERQQEGIRVEKLVR
ncbi:MAG: hypothetical protein ACK5VE_08655 [Alphaproteobacteria bacterium]